MLKRLLGFLGFGEEEPFGARSSQWVNVRKAHLDKQPTCQVCGSKERLVVHHIVPYHLDKTKELEPENLLTMCESPMHNCHFIWGHFLRWNSHNVNVIEDAKVYLEKLKNRP